MSKHQDTTVDIIRDVITSAKDLDDLYELVFNQLDKYKMKYSKDSVKS